MKMSIFARVALVLGILIVVFGLRGTAGAQGEPIKNAREAVFESIEKLETLKGEIAINPIERLRRETELKRRALVHIIQLSILETEAIQEKLAGLRVDLRFLPLEKEFTKNLEEHLKYFRALEEVLESTGDLEGIQRIAGQLRDWRRLTYDPEIAKAVELVLVFQNREVLVIAVERFEKMSAELKRKAEKTRTLSQSIISQASLDLKEARLLNEEALTLLLGYLPARGKMIKDEETSPANPETKKTIKENAEAENPKTINTLVEGSLLKIKAAYRKFIELNEILRK